MIRMEYPKANIEGLSTEEKVIAVKRQLDMLTNNVQLVLESINGDLEGIIEYIGGVPDEGVDTVTSVVDRVDAVEKTVGDIEDYIVEQGTSGNWTYEKWNSGICKAWYYESFNFQPSFTQKATGIYSHEDWTSREITLPSGLFTSVRYANANINTNSYVHIGVPAYSNVGIVVRLWMDLATSPKLQGLCAEVVGRWK